MTSLVTQPILVLLTLLTSIKSTGIRTLGVDLNDTLLS